VRIEIISSISDNFFPLVDPHLLLLVLGGSPASPIFYLPKCHDSCDQLLGSSPQLALPGMLSNLSLDYQLSYKAEDMQRRVE
jgi:hypothetical protein